MPICHVPRIKANPACALVRIYFPSTVEMLGSACSYLSLARGTMADGGKLVKTNCRRNCTVCPTIVFTNMVFGGDFVDVLGSRCSDPLRFARARAAPRRAGACVRITGAISARALHCLGAVLAPAPKVLPEHSARTVPVQCPHSARNSARWKKP